LAEPLALVAFKNAGLKWRRGESICGNKTGRPGSNSKSPVMKIINPRIHGILDYVVVAAFAIAPTAAGLKGLPALISYSLAVVHLLLTLVTDFPLGVAKIVPLRIHGAIEFVVSIALVALPWMLNFALDVAARNFYVGAGALIFAVWLVTDYRAELKSQ
jgi:hypothetical protein